MVTASEMINLYRLDFIGVLVLEVLGCLRDVTVFFFLGLDFFSFLFRPSTAVRVATVDIGVVGEGSDKAAVTNGLWSSMLDDEEPIE